MPNTKVEALFCPQCTGQIEGSGTCPNCGHKLLVTREYGILTVFDHEIEGIVLEPPSGSRKYWIINNWGWNEDVLVILGEGSADIGARLVAKWCVDHKEDYGPGSSRPHWRKIQDYIIALVLKQNN